MLNKFIVQGRCTKDIQIRGNENSKYILFTLASNFNKEKVNFIDLKAFGKTAEFIAQYVSKGTCIIAEGIVESGSFEKDGKKIYSQSLIVNNVYFSERKESTPNDEPKNNYDDALLFD